jgi:hypothetical protein
MQEQTEFIHELSYNIRCCVIQKVINVRVSEIRFTILGTMLYVRIIRI